MSCKVVLHAMAAAAGGKEGLLANHVSRFYADYGQDGCRFNITQVSSQELPFLWSFGNFAF